MDAYIAQYLEDMAYRVYVSDSLFLYARNKTKNERFYEWIRPKKDDRDAQDIIADTIKNAGLIVKKGDPSDGII